jgi:uncharacterized metal-binding protein YceD (DUF177 family)
MAKQLDYTKINPHKLRRAGIEIKHTFMVSQLERLGSWLADDSGELTILCQFEWTKADEILMHLVIDGEVNVSCKSCLKEFLVNWSSKTTLVLDKEDIHNDDSADELYEHVLMSHTGTVNLIDVVIDELILGIPERHPQQCNNNLIVEV